jgi:hypothetical protein
VTTILDPHSVNHATVAVRNEMTLRGKKDGSECNALFLGGLTPSDVDETALGEFAITKNYNLVFASFDPDVAPSTPTGYHVIATDGLTQAMVVRNGRLWKGDRRSRTLLLFPDAKMLFRFDSKGRISMRELKGQYHDHGYELASEELARSSATSPGHIPIVSPIGQLVTILDVKALRDAFELAE